jgi:CspA family cold shock protein
VRPFPKAQQAVRNNDFIFARPEQPTLARPGAFCRGHSQHFSSSPMLTGTVKFYNDTKGFGFIVADDNQEEIFVHQTGLIHEIQEGDRVQFNIKAGKKGPNAVDVTRLQ